MTAATVAVRTLPRVSVTVDGRTLTDDLARSLASVRVQHRRSAPSLGELTFRQPAGLDSEPRDLTPGASIEINVESPAPAQLFSGQITAVALDYHADHAATMRVRAYDRLHLLRKQQPVRAHVDVTLEAFTDELVAPLGAALRLTDEAASGPLPRWDRIMQHCQSDLGLLAEIMDHAGLGFSLDGDDLRAYTYEGFGADHRYRYGADLREARFEINGDPACRSARAIGWNALTGTTHDATAGDGRSARDANADPGPDRFAVDGAVTLTGLSSSNDDQTAARAQALVDARLAREVTAWGVVDGDAELRAGSRVVLEGVSSSVQGRYVLTEVDHTIDEHAGYVTRFSSAPLDATGGDGSGRRTGYGIAGTAPNAAAITIAQITRIDDPDGLGRVKASLPTYDDLETEWMQVICPGAGEGKGFVALPDVDDRVVVLMDGGDPARGLVLGGIYGMSRTDDPGVDDGAVRRSTWRTPDGQLFRLDRDGDKIRFENATGSFVELTDTHLTLHAATDLTLEAPGKALTIRADRIDFRRG